MYRLTAIFPLIFLLMAWPVTGTEENKIGYQVPAPALADLVQQPLPPNSRLSPDRNLMLLEYRPGLTSIAALAEEELRLGGLRIKPQLNGPSRERHAERYELLPFDGRPAYPISGLPEGANLGNVTWSPKGSHVAFTNTTPTGIELWVAEAQSGQAKRLTPPILNMVADFSPRWFSNDQHLIVPIVPRNRASAPKKSNVPTGPVVQENLGEVSPARTYQDLLKNAHDEDLFEHYLTAQLVKIDLKGKMVPLGKPAMIWNVSISPDNQYLLVDSLRRPFSYLVPAWRFPGRFDIWTADGDFVKTIHERPLQESIPTTFGSVETGPRNFGWRTDQPATLYWAEALDGGDAGKEVEERDRVFLLEAPFDGKKRAIATLKTRLANISWSDDELALVTGFWWKTRKLEIWRIRPDKEKSEADLLFDFSFEDRYNNPGGPVTIANENGQPVLWTMNDGRTLLMQGEGASPEGDRPFLDLFDLETKEKKRIFHSEAPYFERPVGVLDGDLTRIITRRESVDQPADFFLRDLKKNTLTRLTERPHPTPSLVGLSKELLRYERADGIPLTAKLYLPPGYDAERDGPLPVIVWAYPQEFKSAEAAGQVTTSPYRFDTVGWWSPLVWLTQGFAVLDDPSMPIVGEGEEEPNDTFIEQLVMSAEAAVETLVESGVARRDQIAVGGHSYGAFMTAHLLAHTDLFAAGIARSGAYNRTLTPFGFQAEERTFWEAPELYFKMSPFTHASKINEPLLLVHGAADNNPGTYPMQSERLYNALKGLGATTRLVMLPHESHGYRAKESILHLLWESQSWLDAYVKSKDEEIEVKKASPDQQGL